MIFSSLQVSVSAGSIILYLFTCVLLGTCIIKNRKGACKYYLIHLVKICVSDVLNTSNIFI